MTPVARRALDGDGDLLSRLRLLIEEEAPLWEVPLGGIEYGIDVVRHGPWDPADCSAVLLRWLDAGLLGLYRLRVHDGRVSAGQSLDHAEARLVLSAPQTWGVERSGHTCLFATGRGEGVPDEHWYSVVRHTE